MNIPLHKGISIRIKRKDGNVHFAKIHEIDYKRGVVRVEWTENDEAKAKDIEFHQVTSLNPRLIFTSPPVKRQSTSPVPRTIISGIISRNKSPKRYNISSSSHRTFTPPIHHTTVDILPSVPLHSTSKLIAKKQVSPKQKTTPMPDYTIPEPPKCSTKDVVTSIANQKMNDDNSSIITQKSNRSNCTLKKINKIQQNRAERQKFHAESIVETSRKSMKHPRWDVLDMIHNFRARLHIRPLSAKDEIVDHQITVAVRKRPMNHMDIVNKEIDIITIPSKNQLIVHEPKDKVDRTRYLENHSFQFDYTFNESCSNVLVYKYTAKPLVKSIFEGCMATCFAYGQTGSGKTFTMTGNFTELNSEKGIYALTAADIFELVNSSKYKNLNLSVTCSFFEIYLQQAFDLLNNKAVLRILEDGSQQVRVRGLKEFTVHSVEEVLKLIHTGNAQRASGQTSANLNSSRSHAIFQFHLKSPKKLAPHGKFSLIDLAGNERGADTFASSMSTRREGSDINRSLLALKECIRALGRKQPYLPFRSCKLTQVLRDSFIGDKSRTCMIAMISPNISSCENTLNTLRYADRVKELGGAGDVDKMPDNIPTWKENSLITPLEGKAIPLLRSPMKNKSGMQIRSAPGKKSPGIQSGKFKQMKDNTKVKENHRETLAILKKTVKDSQELSKGKFSCKMWKDILERGITSLITAKNIVDVALQEEAT